MTTKSRRRDENGKILRVYAEISNPHALKTLVEWLNSTNIEGNLIFSKKEITFFRSNADKTVTNTFTLKTHKIKDYIYNSSEEEIVFGFTLVELKKIITSIGKKDYLKLKLLRDDSRLYILPLSSEDVGEGGDLYQKLSFQHIKDSRMGQIEFTRPLDDPICNVVIGVFCKKAANLGKLGKNGTFFIEVFPNGIALQANEPGNIAVRSWPFGDCRKYNYTKVKDDEGNIIKIKEKNKTIKYEIEHNTIKAFGKISGFSNIQDCFQVYTEEDKPLRFIFDIGNYAELKIDITSSDS